MKTLVSRETFTKMLTAVGVSAFFFTSQVGATEQAASNATPKSQEVAPLNLAILQIIEHPALDQVRQGAMDKLKELGYQEGNNLVISYKNAQGNIAVSSQTANALMANDPKPNVFMAIGTPTAQSAISAGRKHRIPVVFAAVTDPVSSKLVSDLEDHRPLITGVIDFPPIQDQLKLMMEIVPDIKKVGVIYNSGESNSVSVIKAFKKQAEEMGIEVVDGIVSKSSDISLSFRRLHAENVKVIYVPQDNTVISAAASLAQLSIATNIPVFTSDSGSVQQGALATLSYQYYDVGQKAAEYVVRLHNGEDALDLPIEAPATTSLYINTDTAAKLGIKIPQGLLEKATLFPVKK